MCIVRTKCVPGYFVCTKRLIKLSVNAVNNGLNARSPIRSVIFPLKNKQTRSSWCVTKGIPFLKRRENQSKMLLEMCIAQNIITKSVFTFQTMRMLKIVSTTAKSAKAAVRGLILHLGNKIWQTFFGGAGTHCFTRETSRDCETKKNVPLATQLSPPITINPTRTWTNKYENHSVYDITVSSPDWLIQLIEVSFRVSFYTISIYSQAVWFAVSDQRIPRSLAFRPDFVVFTKNLVQELSMSS